MREIKFRAWDGETMWEVRELEWAGGEVIHAYLGLHEVDADKITLMQFTGLHDKNGKEIYEGDVVHWKPVGLGTVRFGASAAFVHDQEKLRGGTGINQLHRSYQQEYEIIGNIYENPELLK